MRKSNNIIDNQVHNNAQATSFEGFESQEELDFFKALAGVYEIEVSE